MTDRPTGTVTFLFTDIEGSTRLWEKNPDAMQPAFKNQEQIIREAATRHDGYAYKMIGDAFQVAFATARDALDAAMDAQRALFLEFGVWELGVKVRMALHTGVTEERGDDYVGAVLNRASRLLSAGHGGQVLVSDVTQGLLRDHLPANVLLRDMGERRLQDLTRAEHIYQVVTPDLPSEFPPLKTLDTVPNNLPVQLTSFIGREKEIVEIKRLLATTRLLTLTGAGGCGKTRLTIQVAAEVLDGDDSASRLYKDGGWFIALAPLTDPALIPQTAVSALRLHQGGERPWMTVLTEFLRARTALLILDNCEHMVADCATFADTILRAAPNVKIFASSREALGIAGETAYHVPSLSLPPTDFRSLRDFGSLSQYDSVRLFIDRAVAVSTSFSVTNANAPAVAQICHRLDGIPLAIELAAARVKGMKIEQLAQRLDDRFDLLTGGSRTALPRQQTLRALIDWSYDLLSESERMILRRLAVFAGGWTIEAAEAICSDETDTETQRHGDKVTVAASPRHPVTVSDVLDLLLRLVDKSLVVMDDQSDETRYRMLETIREYAHDKLLDSGEGNGVRVRHRDWFLSFAENAEPLLFGPNEFLWLNRLELEQGNLRAALKWSLEDADLQSAARLAVALGYFWERHAHFGEARRWLDAVIARKANLPKSLEAKLTYYAGWHASRQFDLARAKSLGETSLALAREMGDQRDIVRALRCLHAAALYAGDAEQLRVLTEQELALAREIGDKQLLVLLFDDLTWAAFGGGEYSAAISILEEQFALLTELGMPSAIVWNRMKIGLSFALNGDYERSASALKESLAQYEKLGNKYFVAICLGGFAYIAVGRKKPLRAVRLFGAIETILESIGVTLPPSVRHNFRYDEMLSAARAQIEESAFSAVWNEGRAMTLEQAIEYGLKEGGKETN